MCEALVSKKTMYHYSINFQNVHKIGQINAKFSILLNIIIHLQYLLPFLNFQYLSLL